MARVLKNSEPILYTVTFANLLLPIHKNVLNSFSMQDLSKDYVYSLLNVSDVLFEVIVQC